MFMYKENNVFLEDIWGPIQNFSFKDNVLGSAWITILPRKMQCVKDMLKRKKTYKQRIFTLKRPSSMKRIMCISGYEISIKQLKILFRHHNHLIFLWRYIYVLTWQNFLYSETLWLINFNKIYMLNLSLKKNQSCMNM